MERKVNEDALPSWLFWKTAFPPLPGWYWVAAPKVWPQCVEISWNGGVLKIDDRHAQSAKTGVCWTHFAGPIPDPPMPIKLKGKHGYY